MRQKTLTERHLPDAVDNVVCCMQLQAPGELQMSSRPDPSANMLAATRAGCHTRHECDTCSSDCPVAQHQAASEPPCLVLQCAGAHEGCKHQLWWLASISCGVTDPNGSATASNRAAAFANAAYHTTLQPLPCEARAMLHLHPAPCPGALGPPGFCSAWCWLNTSQQGPKA